MRIFNNRENLLKTITAKHFDWLNTFDGFIYGFLILQTGMSFVAGIIILVSQCIGWLFTGNWTTVTIFSIGFGIDSPAIGLNTLVNAFLDFHPIFTFPIISVPLWYSLLKIFKLIVHLIFFTKFFFLRLFGYEKLIEGED
jgi:hypothetical protein